MIVSVFARCSVHPHMCAFGSRQLQFVSDSAAVIDIIIHVCPFCWHNDHLVFYMQSVRMEVWAGANSGLGAFCDLAGAHRALIVCAVHVQSALILC